MTPQDAILGAIAAIQAADDARTHDEDDRFTAADISPRSDLRLAVSVTLNASGLRCNIIDRDVRHRTGVCFLPIPEGSAADIVAAIQREALIAAYAQWGLRPSESSEVIVFGGPL